MNNLILVEEIINKYFYKFYKKDECFFIQSKKMDLLSLYLLKSCSSGKKKIMNIERILEEINKDLLSLKKDIFILWKNNKFSSELKKILWVKKKKNWLVNLFLRLPKTEKKKKSLILKLLGRYSNPFYYDLILLYRNYKLDNEILVKRELGLL